MILSDQKAISGGLIERSGERKILVVESLMCKYPITPEIDWVQN
jgi:hypothetical protein